MQETVIKMVSGSFLFINKAKKTVIILGIHLSGLLLETDQARELSYLSFEEYPQAKLICLLREKSKLNINPTHKPCIQQYSKWFCKTVVQSIFADQFYQEET